MKARAAVWMKLAYPFGSEMPWDSTGQEEVYAWTKYFGDTAKARVTLDAIVAYMPTVPHWGYNGSARRYWDFLYGGKVRRVERQLHHYGSGLNAIPVLSEYRDHPDDLHLLRIGYAGTMGALTNIDQEGFASAAFHSFPDMLKPDPISGDYAPNFFGHALNTATYVVQASRVRLAGVRRQRHGEGLACGQAARFVPHARVPRAAGRVDHARCGAHRTGGVRRRRADRAWRCPATPPRPWRGSRGTTGGGPWRRHVRAATATPSNAARSSSRWRGHDVVRAEGARGAGAAPALEARWRGWGRASALPGAMRWPGQRHSRRVPARGPRPPATPLEALPEACRTPAPPEPVRALKVGQAHLLLGRRLAPHLTEAVEVVVNFEHLLTVGIRTGLERRLRQDQLDNIGRQFTSQECWLGRDDVEVRVPDGDGQIGAGSSMASMSAGMASFPLAWRDTMAARSSQGLALHSLRIAPASDSG